ncbi:MAG: MBL fold metallo-hydrolase [Coriobacteriales bacterium]|nr:MBL fold metallo-hydrolase [Coriobacteriales bacterium]
MPPSRLKLHVLSSGSGGNASIVEDSDTGDCIAIDCGICKRDFLMRSAECGVDLSRLRAILITHDHSDHVCGLGVVMRGLAKQGAHPTIYADEAVQLASGAIRKLQAISRSGRWKSAATSRYPPSECMRSGPPTMPLLHAGSASNAETNRSGS